MVTEAELKAKAKGRRVTLEDLEANIAHEIYANGEELGRVFGQDIPRYGALPEAAKSLMTLTICVLVLKNGFTIFGQSACADPKNYDREIGEELARANAVNQIWPLMGYALRDEMKREELLLKSRAFETYLDKTYVGTKVVAAAPMNRRDYNELRGWTLPENENGADEGYLVEYTDRVENPPHVPGFKGYVSWSPKEVFERAYRRVGASEAQPSAAAGQAPGASGEDK